MLLRTCVIAWLGCAATVTEGQANADGSPTEEAQKPALLIADVVDDVTGEPIAEFTALPGVSPISWIGWQWQPHRIIRFEAGALRWPPAGRRGYREEQILRIEAAGYRPLLSPVIMPLDRQEDRGVKRVTRPTPQGEEVFVAVWPTSEEPARVTLRMRRGAVAGRVIDSDGQPVAGAVVAAGLGQFQRAYFHHGKVWRPAESEKPALRDEWRRPFYTESDEDGAFELPVEIGSTQVLASHDRGVASVIVEPGTDRLELRLEPLGRIEGRCEWNGKPGANVKLYLFATAHQNRTTTDAQGRFVFDQVPPGVAAIGRNSHPHGSGYVCMNPTGRLQVLAGGVTRCVLGGVGRPVEGRVTGFNDWRRVRVSVHLNRSWPSPSFRDPDDPTLGAFHQFVSSRIYRHYDTEEVGIAEDGSFRFDCVPAESWVAAATERRGEEVLGLAETLFKVEMMPEGESDTPQRIEELALQAGARASYPKIRPRTAELSPELLEYLRAKQPAEALPHDQ